MPSEPPRSSDSFSIWLLISAAAVIVGALFSASRTKPPVIFLPAFGAVMGLVMRGAATSLAVERNRRVVAVAMLLVGCGAILCFVPSYRREALQWNAVRLEQPDNPLAAAIIASSPPPPFSVGQYLSQRFPEWPSPWPTVFFGAEWVGCMIIAGLCVGVRRSRGYERPVPKTVADASGSEVESSS
jgi:hypothetical protein